MNPPTTCHSHFQVLQKPVRYMGILRILLHNSGGSDVTFYVDCAGAADAAIAAPTIPALFIKLSLIHI